MTILTLALSILLQDQVDNPEFKGWEGFKPGSSVTFKVVSTLHPEGGEQKTSLKSAGEAELVVVTDMSIGGKPVAQGQERKVPAKIPAEKAPKDVKKGEEEIEAGGKKLKCVTKEFEVTAAGGKTATMKIWVSDEVPGRAARIDITAAGGVRNSMVASSWEKK